MNEKIILITGGTTGIGKAACHRFAICGNTVVVVARDKIKADNLIRDLRRINGGVVTDYILGDLSSLKSVREIAETFRNRYQRLDILVNNAGLIMSERVMTPDGFEMTFAVNHLSHFLLTNLLLDRLKASPSARIINTSSGAQDAGKINIHDIHFEKKFSPFASYCQSKLANNIFTTELAKRLRDTNITVNSFHPGFIRSGFGQGMKKSYVFIIDLLAPLARAPEKGAETMVWLALSDDIKNVTGRFFYNKKERKFNKLVNDDELVRGFWDLSEKLTGVKY